MTSGQNTSPNNEFTKFKGLIAKFFKHLVQLLQCLQDTVIFLQITYYGPDDKIF